MIQYRVSPIQNNISGNGETLYQPVITNRKLFTLEDLSKLIAAQSTVSPIDTLAVIEALVDNIPDLLLDNKIVSLGSLGTLKLFAQVTNGDHPEQISHRNIRGLRVHYLPSKLLKDRLGKARFERVR